MAYNYFSGDWREKVAAMTAVNDQDIEKAFFDQASGFVENKLAPLMKDEHRVGFEIVKKNDENTRMVGIFAFKVDKNLLFGVVFFINGEIKGPLLYRCDTKTFVPATKEWASYLIDALDHSEGKGQDTSKRVDSPPMVNMHRITFLPHYLAKGASVEVAGNKPAIERRFKLKPTNTPGEYVAEIATATPKDRCIGNTSSCWALDVCTDCSDGTIHVKTDAPDEEDKDICLTHKQASALLQDGRVSMDIAGITVHLEGEAKESVKEACFGGDGEPEWYGNLKEAAVNTFAATEGKLMAEMCREQDFGKVASEAILKAAEMNPAFAEQVARLYGSPADLFPAEYTFTAKEATAKPELSIVFDAAEVEKKAGTIKDDFWRDGCYILDTRPEETLSVVYEEMPSTITSPDGPGVYDVLKTDGSMLSNAIVCQKYVGKFGWESDSSNSSPKISRGQYDSQLETPKHLVIKDGKICLTSGLLGRYNGELDKASELKDTVESDTTYLAIVDGYGIGPIRVKKVKTSDGVKYCDIDARDDFSYGDMYYAGYGDITRMIVNPDLEKSDLAHATFGKDAKFVKLEAYYHESYNKAVRPEGDYPRHIRKLEDIGGVNTISKFVFDQFGADTFKVRKAQVFGDTTKSAYVFEHNGKHSKAFSKLASLVKLAQDMEISADKSYDILRKADAEGVADVTIHFNKEASRLHVVDQPNFEDEFDSDFGMAIEPRRTYHLRVHGDQIFENPSSIGDAMNPTSLTGLPETMVVNTDPMELQSLADAYKLPNVFEHGVVGSLANTFNATAMVRKYLSKLEDGVDALGRIKFLLYWCPDDFEKKYGEDDLANMSAEIDSNYNALGALLLDLIKKSDKLQREEGDEKKDKDNE